MRQFEAILNGLPKSPETVPTSLGKTASSDGSLEKCSYVRSESMCAIVDHIAAAQGDFPPPSKLPPKSQSQPDKKTCVQATQLVLSVVNKMLVRLDTTVKMLKTKYGESAANWLRVQTSQLKILADYALPTATTADSNCIYYKPFNDHEWTKLRPYYVVDVWNEQHGNIGLCWSKVRETDGKAGERRPAYGGLATNLVQADRQLLLPRLHHLQCDLLQHVQLAGPRTGRTLHGRGRRPASFQGSSRNFSSI